MYLCIYLYINTLYIYNVSPLNTPQANSRLLSHTCLALPTRAHLRWVELFTPL